jgi:L-fucose mutarotase
MIMLIGIPPIISPELMKVLMEMGHGDELVLADSNFPAVSSAQRLVRCDGHNIPKLLAAILKFFPLDTYVEKPAILMETVPGDLMKPTIWNEYNLIIKDYKVDIEFDMLERFAFYERAKRSFAIVTTGEKALYANLILKKGVVK